MTTHHTRETIPKHRAGSHRAVGDLFDDYSLATTAGRAAVDEMFERPGAPNPCYRSLFDALAAMSADEVAERCATRDRTFRDQGITFSLSGEERPFPLDLIPRIVDADDWQLLAGGVRQRVKALECFLADVYGEARILDDGVVPRG